MHSNQPVLAHDHPAYLAAEKAERDLLNHYQLVSQDHWITLQNSSLRIRVSEIGTGAPVFVVPGNTGDMFPFIPLIKKLPHFQFFLFNRPGGGLSDGMDHEQVDIRPFIIDTIDAVLNSLGLDSIPFVAHSMGAHWSLWYALARPERVKKLALIGNPGRVMLDKTPGPLKLILLPGVGDFLINQFISTQKEHAMDGLKRMGTRANSLEKLPDEFKEAYFRFQNLPHYKLSSLSLLRTFNKNRENTIRKDELNRLTVPTLFLWGENDTFASVEKGREISSQIRQSTFYPIKDAGHMPWLDQPETCAQEINRFLSPQESSPD